MEHSSTGAVHQRAHSVVSPFTHCGGLQRTLLCTLPWAPPPLWEYRQSALCPSHTMYTKPLMQSHRHQFTAVKHRGHSSCTTGRYGSSPDPSPTFISMHTQSPQLLKPDLSQPQEHPLSTCMSQRHWVTKLATVLWIYSHWGEGSAFNSASECGHPCIPAEFTQAALRKKHLWQTPPPPSFLH